MSIDECGCVLCECVHVCPRERARKWGALGVKETLALERERQRKSSQTQVLTANIVKELNGRIANKKRATAKCVFE